MIPRGHKVLKPVHPEVYVYEHWRPDTGACFYAGKGRKRRLRHRRRNAHHQAITQKLARAGLDYEVRIVASGLTDEQAFKIEVERIAHWRAIGVDLANLTDGGDGPKNPTEEVRRKIREARSRQVVSDDDRAKHRLAMSSPAVRQRLSAAAKARTSNSFKGRSHSAETRAAWSKKRKGQKLSEGHRAKISAGLLVHNGFKGKKHSAESRLLMSITKRERFGRGKELSRS